MLSDLHREMFALFSHGLDEKAVIDACAKGMAPSLSGPS